MAGKGDRGTSATTHLFSVGLLLASLTACSASSPSQHATEASGTLRATSSVGRSGSTEQPSTTTDTPQGGATARVTLNDTVVIDGQLVNCNAPDALGNPNEGPIISYASDGGRGATGWPENTFLVVLDNTLPLTVKHGAIFIAHPDQQNIVEDHAFAANNEFEGSDASLTVSGTTYHITGHARNFGTPYDKGTEPVPGSKPEPFDVTIYGCP